MNLTMNLVLLLLAVFFALVVVVVDFTDWVTSTHETGFLAAAVACLAAAFLPWPTRKT